MVRRCVLAMSAVMVATRACAPDPDFLSERAIEDAKTMLSVFWLDRLVSQGEVKL